MKHLLTKNWFAKIASLIAAAALWYVVKEHIKTTTGDKPPKAIPISE